MMSASGSVEYSRGGTGAERKQMITFAATNLFYNRENLIRCPTVVAINARRRHAIRVVSAESRDRPPREVI
jgi:hypothetical protein